MVIPPSETTIPLQPMQSLAVLRLTSGNAHAQVNQHAGICATPPSQDSTGHDIVPCNCGTAKEFQGDLSDSRRSGYANFGVTWCDLFIP